MCHVHHHNAKHPTSTTIFVIIRGHNTPHPHSPQLTQHRHNCHKLDNIHSTQHCNKRPRPNTKQRERGTRYTIHRSLKSTGRSLLHEPIMDMFSLSSTAYCSHTSSFSATSIRTPTTTPPLTRSLKASQESDNPTNLRRPNTHKPLKIPPSKPTLTTTKFPKNPLKNLIHPGNNPPTTTSNTSQPPHSLTTKLWLTSKLSPPPPPPPPSASPQETLSEGNEVQVSGDSEKRLKTEDFRQEGKIFVGNLPLRVKKHEVAEYFRQFGPIKNVILIKGHDNIERNMGFGFVIYGGQMAGKAAMKAVEFDGVEFHGRVLTVKLDDGKRVKARAEERVRWVEGEDGVEYRSKWHEAREGSRTEFRNVLETQPENWQAVVRAFERIKKVLLLNIHTLVVLVACFRGLVSRASNISSNSVVCFG
ncbi:unnamed protein product [Ilex paraguariensis]|uniref:RRM domain-containing protein n=1 Tax=Ilex paraguariensis TaxID=185542 RepID=A0ABC8SBX8_9AQUA